MIADTHAGESTPGASIETSELWQLQISLANYAPDSADTPEISFRGHARSITVDEYLDQIYVAHDVEQYEVNLAREIRLSSRVLCIAGERGAGKTSAILWARKQLAREDPSLRFELIDIRRSYDSLDLSWLDECPSPTAETTLRLERSFKEMVRDALMQSLFPATDDYLTLVAWAAAGPPDDSQRFDSVVTADLQDLHGEAMGYAQWALGSTRMARQNHLLDLFRKDAVVFERLRSRLWQRLRVTHLIHAYLCHSSIHRRLILVLDNIDRIPTDHQPHFLSAARDIQLSCGSASSTAISVRTENARDVHVLPGDELFVDVILLDNVKYSGLLLPSLEAAHAKSVLEAREQFARRVLSEHDSKYGGTWDGLHSQRLLPYHSSIVTEFIDDKVHALANDSCRVLLSLYVEFMRYIWTVSERRDEDGRALLDLPRLAEDPDKKHIQTLFFLWLHQRGRDVGIPLQNIVEHDFDASAQTFAEAASPQYLLLTCIHSLTQEANAQALGVQGPAWAAVVRRMKSLGFPYPAIQGAANSFLAPVGEPAGMLRFSRREVGTTKIPETSTEPVILTKLGTEILTSVINKAGYVWGVARRRVGAEDSRKGYYYFDTAARARHIYAFAKHLAKEHLRILQLLGAQWRPLHGATWTDKYRREFGISMKLQCEAILDSAASFYAHVFASDSPDENPFRVLRRAYSSLFEALATRTIGAQLLRRLDAGDSIIDRLKPARRL